MEYQAKLVLEFFCRNSPSRTFLLLSGGNPGTKTLASNKLPVPLLLWTDWKVGGCSGQKTPYSNSPSLSCCFIRYRSNSERKKTPYKICRVTITTSTKRPEGTDCWRRCHGNDSFFFRVCDLCVTKAFFAWVFSITPVCSSECFCCKIIYKIGGWKRGHKMEYLWDLQR